MRAGWARSRPDLNVLAVELRPIEQPLHGALRMLFAHVQPGLFGQALIQARQHDAALRRLGDDLQQGGRGGRGSG